MVRRRTSFSSAGPLDKRSSISAAFGNGLVHALDIRRIDPLTRLEFKCCLDRLPPCDELNYQETSEAGDCFEGRASNVGAIVYAVGREHGLAAFLDVRDFGRGDIEKLQVVAKLRVIKCPLQS